MNQITKDSVTGSVLISSPTDSGMVYSRDLFISYGADTVLILGGDTIVLQSDLVAEIGDSLLNYVSKTELSDSTTNIRTDIPLIITDSLLNYVNISGTQTITGAKTFSTAIVVNEDGNDVDTRFEGDTDANLLYLDASEDRVGIGTNSPSALLHVEPDPGTSANFMKYDGTRLVLEYGDRNIAIGNNAGNSSSGNLNLTFGANAGQNLQSTASNNAFIGVLSGANNNVSGDYNLGFGYASLYNLTSGNNNISLSDGLFITSGSNNIILGLNAGRTSGGGSGITTGNDNIYVGIDATASGATVTNEIAIGKGAIGQGSNSIMLGNSSITSLFCYDTSISSPSDLRDKKNVQNLNAGLDFVNMLRPVVFEWNMREGTKQGISDIGFIAQELEMAQMQSNQKDYINLTMYSESNDRWFAQYANLIPIYAKAIQDLDKKLEEKESEIETLKTLITELSNRLTILENN